MSRWHDAKTCVWPNQIHDQCCTTFFKCLIGCFMRAAHGRLPPNSEDASRRVDLVTAQPMTAESCKGRRKCVSLTPIT
jgi:hypothetical protein